MKTKSKTRNPRINFSVAVDVEAESRLQQFYSKNLSSGGIFLEIPGNPPPLGTKLRLQFTIPNLDRKFVVQAQVIHHHNYQSMNPKFSKNVETHGIGLRFLDLSPDDQKVITQFISGKDLHVSQ